MKNKTKYFSSLKGKKCGDKIKVELEIKDKKIKNMYYETESCIFCQASASVISKYVKDLMVKNLDKIETHKILSGSLGINVSGTPVILQTSLNNIG